MTTLITVVIAFGTVAFGAVYPWGYIPLLVAASAIGVVGLYRSGLPRDLRPLATLLFVVCAAGAIQLLPMPPGVLARISPATPALLESYDLAFAGASAWAPISIRPQNTAVAVMALCAISLYLLGLPGLLGPRTLRSLPGALAILAVPLALYGIYTREYNNGLIYGFWQPLDGGGSNQAGPFVNRNHFGGWMLMALGVLIGSLLGHFEGVLQGTRARESNTIARLSSRSASRLMRTGAVVVLGIVAVFWSLSRSSILGLAAAMTLFIWLASRRRRFGAARRVAVISLGAAVFTGLMWRGLGQVLAWFQDERNLLSRFDAWRDGWEVTRAFPLFGTGLNTFGDAMLFYQSRNPGFHMAQAHNDYLQLAAEGGLLVVLPAGATALVLVHAISRNLRATRAESRGYWIRAGAAVGLAAVAVQEVFEFSLQIPVNALLFATLAAIALSPAVPHGAHAAVSRDTIFSPGQSHGVLLS